MQESCHIMNDGEILNSDKKEYPLYEAVIYGDKYLSQKLSKRLSCAIKHLPIRVRFSYETDTQKAVEIGLSKDPSLVLDGKIFIEGLIQSEEITDKFKKL